MKFPRIEYFTEHSPPFFRFEMHAGVCLVLICALIGPSLQRPQDSLPAMILGGIGNVASSATDFLSSAVERPRNLLINATRATTGIIDSAASRGLEFKLRRFLEKIRRRMSQGIPELGIPVLEPLQLDEVDVKIDNPEIGNISLVITDLIVHKLSTFLIDKAKLSLVGPTISVNVSVPEVYAEGQYNVSGNIGDKFVLRGAGPFRANIFDLRVYVHTVLGFSRGVYLKTFDLDFNVGSVILDVEDFMKDGNISKIMTKVAQELIPEAMDIIKPDVLPGIQNYIAGRANETINHLTMRDIFTVLLGNNEFRDFAHLVVP